MQVNKYLNPVENYVFQFAVYDFHSVKTSLKKHVLLVWIGYKKTSLLAKCYKPVLHVFSLSVSAKYSYPAIMLLFWLGKKEESLKWENKPMMREGRLPDCFSEHIKYFILTRTFLVFIYTWILVWKDLTVFKAA